MGDLGRVQSIDRAVLILKCFSETKTELKLSEISEMLKLNKSTVHGIINTLKFHGLIDQDEKNQKYRLGLDLIELGDLVISSLDIGNVSRDVLDKICDELNETVHIGVLDKLDIVYIEKRECFRSIKTSTKIGGRMPAYSVADGRAVLSGLDLCCLDKIVPEKINKMTPFTLTDKKDIINKILEVKEKGFIIDYEEIVEGLICVAAPIYDYTGKVRYGISVSGPKVRMNEEKIAQVIKIIISSSNEISKRIGYRG